jgi:DNA replication protein DnaC
MTCQICGNTGWRPIERDGLRSVVACECRTQPRSDGWWMDRARIPRRYRDCGFDNFETTHTVGESTKFLFDARRRASRFVEDYPVSGHEVEKGLLFLGRPGVGKTHLAVAVLKQLMIQKSVDGLFCAYQELLQRIRDSYDPVSLSTEAEVLRPILHTDVVVIDDLGANRVSDWVEDTITYILNHRYNEKKATILTSNLEDLASDADRSNERSAGGKYRLADTLTDRIGVRVRSRLYEMCDVVTIVAEDFRATVKAH